MTNGYMGNLPQLGQQRASLAQDLINPPSLTRQLLPQALNLGVAPPGAVNPDLSPDLAAREDMYQGLRDIAGRDDFDPTVWASDRLASYGDIMTDEAKSTFEKIQAGQGEDIDFELIDAFDAAGEGLRPDVLLDSSDPNLTKTGLKGFGKFTGGAARAMNEGTALRIADYNSSLDLLEQFDEAIDANPDNILFTPVLGAAATYGRAALGDVNAKRYLSSVTLLKQVIAKGLEGGVLRKEDTAKYDAILGKPGNTREQLYAISDEIKKTIRSKKKNDIDALEAVGRAGAKELRKTRPEKETSLEAELRRRGLI